jgi:AP-1-like factor
MDYPYFTAAPQPYQFLGLPPTPAHTGSANSDDFSNSPPVRPIISQSQSQSHTHSQFHTSQSLSSSSSYPVPSLLTYKPQDAFEFQTFDTFNAHFNAAAAANNSLPVAKPPTPLSQHKSSVSGSATQQNTYEINNGDMNDDSMRRGSNSDDDDNMTPAQSRRKAQNRAAYVLLFFLFPFSIPLLPPYPEPI